MEKAPKTVLIGRTNVGKSSLFNKMVEEQKSLVSDIAGTTRDRFEADCIWRGAVMRLVDTGGLDVNRHDLIEKNVIMQTQKALEEADVILFVVDVTVGPTADDLAIARELVAKNTPVIVVGNKADNAGLRKRPETEEWKTWPLSRPVPVSAKQGTGIGDLLDVAVQKLTETGKPPVDVSTVLPMRVAVIGEPNVGKSTLINAILGEERFIAADVPHTTREPNDVLYTFEDKQYLFVDTAGIRKQANRRRSGTALENEGVERTLDLLKRTDVALFVLDVTKGITTQDKHLAGVLGDSGVSVIIVMNKWDLVPNKETNTVNEVEAEIRAWLPQLKYAPVIFTSAIKGQRVPQLFPLIDEVFQNRFTELSGQEAYEFMSRAIMRHRPIKGKGVKHPQIVHFKQERTNPPRFSLKVNLPRTDSLSVSYVRFLENLLREYYEFRGTPIFIRIEKGHEKSHTTRQA